MYGLFKISLGISRPQCDARSARSASGHWCALRAPRRFIHADIGLNSIQTTRDRLLADDAEFDVLEIKDGVQLYRNPVQTMDKIKSLIPGLKNEDSLDSFWEGAISDSKLGTIPVYVPNLMDSAAKLLDKVTMVVSKNFERSLFGQRQLFL